MKYLKHFIVVTKHKYFVMVECFKDGLYWQGIVHDLSKYSPIEFAQSAKYFQGDGTPISVIKKELGHSKAWLNHKGRNKHHWEYWTDFYNGEVKPIPIPEKYMKEWVCDMIGASKAYLKGSYNPEEPLKYFDAQNHKWLLTDEDRVKVRKMLEERLKPKNKRRVNA